MRRTFFTLIFIAAAVISKGQRSVDDLFNKYADNDGFVTISISGNLLKFVRSMDNDDENDSNYSWPEKITEIRILAQEKDDMRVDNFYDLVYRNLNRNQYEEFMRVKKPDQDLVMLVKSNGNRLKELILIVGGGDNVLIQIKGDMTMGEARKLSSEFRHDHNIDIVSHWN